MLRRRYRPLLLAIYALCSVVVSGLALTGIVPRQVAAACSALPTTTGTATFSVSVPASGSYRVWAHNYMPSIGKNRYYLRIDDQYCQLTVGGSNAIGAGKFGWVDYQNGNTGSKLTVSLGAGNHAITLAGLDEGVGVDKLLLLQDQSCVPTGAGTNCDAAPATIQPTPGGKTPVTGTIALPKADSTAGTTRTYLLNGKPVSGNNLDTTKLDDGQHTLQIIERTADGKTKTITQQIVVDNNQSLPARMTSQFKKPKVYIPTAIVSLVLVFALIWSLLRPDWARHVWANMRGFKNPGGTALPEAVVYTAPGTERWWRRKPVIVSFVGSFAALGVLTLYLAYAATTSVSYLMSNAAVGNGAAIVSNSSAIGGKMVQFNTPPTPPTTPPPTTPTPPATPPPSPTGNCTTQVWQNLVACGWPGSTNTGYPAGTSLANTSGRTISANNAVVQNEKISGRLMITGQNVTIKNSWIISTGGGTNGTGVIEIAPGASATIDHVTIDGGNNAHSCVWHKGASMTVTAVNCSRVNDGIFSWQDNGGTSQGNNFTIQDSYFHDLTTATGNGHVDGYQTEGANNGLIKHNTYDISQDQTSAIAIWNSAKSSANIAIENNLLTGGGFTVYAQDYHPSEANPSGGYTVTNITFTNNRFSKKYYGCVGYWGVWFPRGAPSDQWRRTGNTIIETGVSVDTGNPTNNGSPCN